MLVWHLLPNRSNRPLSAAQLRTTSTHQYPSSSSFLGPTEFRAASSVYHQFRRVLMARSRVWILLAVVMTVSATAIAQTTPYQLFGPVYTRPSLSTTSPSSPAAFGTTTLTLS